MADLLDIHERLEELHGALAELADPADVERVAEVIGRIESAAYEAALAVSDDDGIDDDGGGPEGLICQSDESSLGVAIHARFEADSGTADGVEPEVTAETLSTWLLPLLAGRIDGYHMTSHQAYVYREGEDGHDAYIGIEIPMSGVIVEVDEGSD